MAEILINIGISPPSMLGVTVVNVHVGDTVTITKQMLQSSTPPYIQEENLPIGNIEIVGHNDDYRRLLSPSNNSTVRARFTNNGSYISKANQSTTIIANRTVTSATLAGGGFKVTGVAVGSYYITYKATSILSSTLSEYSTITGKILVNVTVPTNNPPSNIDDTQVNCPYLGTILLNYELFTTGYSDPENDDPYKVKFINLPQGITMFMGQQVVNGQEALINDLQNYPLVYISTTATTNGSSETLDFGISDVGSQQFTT